MRPKQNNKPSQSDIILNTENMVKEELENEQSGHDWEHIKRVTNTAVKIAEYEGGNLFVITMSALLHDLIDDKIVLSEVEGLKKVEDWLVKNFVKEEDRIHILNVIKTISFKGGNYKSLNSLEAEIVQDADRLDAIGALGIARCFVYSGKKGRAIFEPSIPVREKMTLKEYRNGKSDSINHFYEKLLKLKDLMNTDKGKELANDRHEFMETFLRQFYLEIDSEPKIL